MTRLLSPFEPHQHQQRLRISSNSKSSLQSAPAGTHASQECVLPGTLRAQRPAFRRLSQSRSADHYCHNMEASGGSTTGSRTDTLGKLLPKAISEKRQRRKQRKQSETTTTTGSLRTLSSDGTSTSNVADEDGDDRSINDDRSFGSFESGPVEADAVVTGSTPQRTKKTRSSRASSRDPSRATSQ